LVRRAVPPQAGLISKLDGTRRFAHSPSLEQARYEVGRARRQYDAVDPDNRLVAAVIGNGD
jgi:hypothetical protein